MGLWVPQTLHTSRDLLIVELPLVARTPRRGWPLPVGAENSDTSCDRPLLVYETTEAVSSQRPNGRCRGRGVRPAGSGRRSGAKVLIKGRGGVLGTHTLSRVSQFR